MIQDNTGRIKISILNENLLLVFVCLGVGFTVASQLALHWRLGWLLPRWYLTCNYSHAERFSYSNTFPSDWSSFWISTSKIKGDLSVLWVSIIKLFLDYVKQKTLGSFLAWGFCTFVEKQVNKVQIDSIGRVPTRYWVTASSLTSFWR